jgi:phage baseplate assembly protein W
MATTSTHNRYGIPLSLATQRSSSSQYKKRYGLRYPIVGSLDGTVTGGALQKNTNQGGYFQKSSGLSLLKGNLRQLLLTEKGERLMLPDYGLSLRKYVFEPLDEVTYFLIKTDILKTLYKYFKAIRVLTVAVGATVEQADRGELSISLTLQLVSDSKEVFDMEVNVK